jgi:phytoene/squalene synthetase
MASALLPEKKRKAARALCEFCRVSDDLIDCCIHYPMASLEIWHQQNLHDHIDQTDEVVL